MDRDAKRRDAVNRDAIKRCQQLGRHWRLAADG
jgi:hypothetical protein